MTLLLTGATGDIGQKIKHYFEAKNISVIAPSRAQMDLSDMQSIDKFMTSLDKEDIDIFIHCAGYNCPVEFEKLSFDELQKTMQINSLSFFSISQHLAPVFRKKKLGYILGISTIYSKIARRKRLAYSASKQAMNAMAQTMALELGSDNIIVNTLAPGFIDTSLTRKNNSSEVIAGFVKKIPLGRLGTPEEIAKAAYWLCSADNTFIHGQCIVADGGYIIGGFEQ